MSDNLCQCGCGQKTSIITQTRPDRGLVKGQYRKFINGHFNRTKRKGQVIEYAISHGFENEKDLLKALMQKHVSYAGIAQEIGITAQWAGKLARYYGINRESRQRYSNTEKRKRWNKKHGTDYQNTREWLAALYEQYGASETANKTGMYVNYVYQCAREQREVDGEQVEKVEADYRPSNLTDWTNPNKSPCVECQFGYRDKNQPGCTKCPSPEKYVQLVESRYYPGTRVPGQSPVYYNARGHAHNWHDWGRK